MLTGNNSVLAHVTQNVALLLLSICFLPLDTVFLLLSYVFRQFSRRQQPPARRRRNQQSRGFHRRTILVTGVGMTKGLTLARMFFEAGHNVIGADVEPSGSLVCGRVSKSLTRFYCLTKPSMSKAGPTWYIQSILDIINEEDVELWVSCSGVASAVDDGMAKETVEARTRCRAIQFDVQTTRTLHEKHTFIEHTRRLGLTVPETHTITSRDSIEEILRAGPVNRKYILKSIGLDDSSRADMTTLPRPTSEQTSQHISRMNISVSSPWILQQYIQGKEYCTHALVIRGDVKAFVACPSSELLMHYAALPPASALSQAMLNFTQKFAAAGGASFTGHLSFDFLVEDHNSKHSGKKEKIVLYPIECNPRAHTAVVLFQTTAGMVDAYLSLLSSAKSTTNQECIIVPSKPQKRYWLPHDVVTLLILPSISLLSQLLRPSLASKSSQEFFPNLAILLRHLLSPYWSEGTFAIWDPLPYWWLYHVYWPMRFAACAWEGRKWSRLNVSTGKMFEC